MRVVVRELRATVVMLWLLYAGLALFYELRVSAGSGSTFNLYAQQGPPWLGEGMASCAAAGFVLLMVGFKGEAPGSNHLPLRTASDCSGQHRYFHS
ncbi:hypothetical protein COO60DRAFT_1583764, partial [Scenedesmus sp. NREL 46B-D3]